MKHTIKTEWRFEQAQIPSARTTTNLRLFCLFEPASPLLVGQEKRVADGEASMEIEEVAMAADDRNV